MVIVDYREKPHKREKRELVDLIRRFGVKAEIGELPYGDFAFDGFDSHGPIAIGIERKRLHDFLGCIEDNRFTAFQRLGLKQLYTEQWLLLEGLWKPHDSRNTLMEGNAQGQWWEMKPAGRPVLYAKLRRALFSIIRSGIPVIYTRDIVQTAYDLCELWHYYQKREHVSLLGKQKMNIPSLNGRPALVRRWAEEIDGIGPKKAELAAHHFKTPVALATSEEIEWLALPGVGPTLAARIIQQISGTSR